MPLTNYFRTDGWVKSTMGPAAAGAQIYVCTQPAGTTTIPPSPLASIFSDPLGASPIAQPVVADGFGHYDFYAAPGVYTLVVVLGGVVQQVYPDQSVGGVGSAGTLVLKVNGTNLSSQLVQNLTGTGVVSVIDAGAGTVNIAAPLAGPSGSLQYNNAGAFGGGAGLTVVNYGDPKGLLIQYQDSQTNLLQVQAEGIYCALQKPQLPGINGAAFQGIYQSVNGYSAQIPASGVSNTFISYQAIGFNASVAIDGEAGNLMGSAMGLSVVARGHACSSVFGVYTRAGALQSVGPQNAYGILVDRPINPATYTPGPGEVAGIVNPFGIYIADQTYNGTNGTALYVAGGVSTFQDPIQVNGFAPSIRSITAAYSATSVDSTINCNGTFTLTLAPSTLTLTSVVTASSLVTSTPFSLYSVVNGGGPSWIYNGVITGGASNAYVGYRFYVYQFQNPNNNGMFVCTASTATSLTLTNPAGVPEGIDTTITHVSETAGNLVTLTVSGSGNLYRVGDSINLDGLTTATWLNVGNLFSGVILLSVSSTTLTFIDPSGHGFLASTAETGLTFTVSGALAGCMSAQYNGTITGGANNAYVGALFTIAGFTNPNNNITAARCTASTATSLILDNQGGANETHAATAAPAIRTNQKYNIKNTGSGTITVASSANIDGAGTVSLGALAKTTVQWDGTTWWTY